MCRGGVNGTGCNLFNFPFNQMHLHLNAAVVCCECVKKRACVRAGL